MKKTQVSYIVIDSAHAGQRIDNYLLSYFKHVPKSHVYRILRKGEVRVNKKRVQASYRLVHDDTVRLPPLKIPSSPTKLTPTYDAVAYLEQAILYEDDDLLIINKPSGIAVHGGSGLHYGLIDMLKVLRPQAQKLELAHRLDRETSGCLILAKNRDMLLTLHQLLRVGKVEKHYLALVKGHLQANSKPIELPLQKNTLRSGERMVEVTEAGKYAATQFNVVKYFNLATLAEINLLTGRTHQIRVHAAHLGHPLAGDPKYGDKAFNHMLKRKGLKRLFLHASKIVLTLPNANKPLSVTAPLSDDLQRLLQSFDMGVNYTDLLN